MLSSTVMTTHEQQHAQSTQDKLESETDSTHQINIYSMSSLMLGNSTSSPAKSSTTRRRSNMNTKKRCNSNEESKTESHPPLPPHPPFPVPPWLNDTTYVNDTSIPFANRLGHEMLRYCEYTQRIISHTHPTIEQAIWNLSICVQEIWPEATVTCFGSFSSGLWLPSSDVDVVLMGIPLTTPHSNVEALERLACNIKQVPWIHHIEVVKSAKVPVAKLILAENDLRVDISIENVHTRLGIEASLLVREYVSIIPMLHPLIIVLKQFLREKGLNDASTGGLSSYCLTLLAFYLIQRQNTLMQGVGLEIGQLLLDFVEFYGIIFQYATTGISLKAEAFGEYRLDLDTRTGYGLSMSPQLVIDDPVYLDGQHNAAAGAFAIARVIAAWENAFYALRFHRPTKFTPTPLCQLLHWSGHGKVIEQEMNSPRFTSEEKNIKPKVKSKSKAKKKATTTVAVVDTIESSSSSSPVLMTVPVDTNPSA